MYTNKVQGHDLVPALLLVVVEVAQPHCNGIHTMWRINGLVIQSMLLAGTGDATMTSGPDTIMGPGQMVTQTADQAG